MTGVQYVAAKFIEKAAADLAETIAAMPEDRLTWRPEPDARPVLDQVIECSLANVMWANTLRTRTHEWLPEGVADRAYSTLDNLEKVTDRLLSSASALAEVIRAIEPSELKDQIAFPWKPEEGLPVAECCFHPYWNMVYHLGQVSFIQTLYGDKEEHGELGPFSVQLSVPA